MLSKCDLRDETGFYTGSVYHQGHLGVQLNAHKGRPICAFLAGGLHLES